MTSPSQLPNTTFSFAVNDVPKNNSWSYSRPNKYSAYNTWLMPLFTSWSWPKPSLGTLDDILARITTIESTIPFNEKIDKVVWRGTPHFNPLAHPHLRTSLLSATKHASFADIQALNNSNALPIEYFCKYKYIVYTEGVTYSGRLPYHQACDSVLITAPLTWLTISALMLRPIWVGDLMGTGEGLAEAPGALRSVERYEDANAIYVDAKFVRLEELVEFLRKRPEIAERIARNQREGMVGAGYLGRAAETCYWRALIRAWSEVAIVDENEWREREGERFETWLLKEMSRTREGTRGKANG